MYVRMQNDEENNHFKSFQNESRFYEALDRQWFLSNNHIKISLSHVALFGKYYIHLHGFIDINSHQHNHTTKNIRTHTQNFQIL